MRSVIPKQLNPFAWLERKALFAPERSFRGNPDHVGLEYADIFPVANDGVRLHGWHMPASASSESRNAVWLILHGNGGNISVRLDQYKAIRDRYGASIIAIDYRGYGKSEGSPLKAVFTLMHWRLTNFSKLRTQKTKKSCLDVLWVEL